MSDKPGLLSGVRVIESSLLGLDMWPRSSPISVPMSLKLSLLPVTTSVR